MYLILFMRITSFSATLLVTPFLKQPPLIRTVLAHLSSPSANSSRSGPLPHIACVTLGLARLVARQREAGPRSAHRRTSRPRGANTSLVHVGWMIGSGDLDAGGMLPDGTAEPLMRKGEWAI